MQLEITVWRAPPILEKMLELLLPECTDVSSCIREATEDVMYVEENLKKNKLPVTPVAPARGGCPRSALNSREVATLAISEITG